MHGDTGATQAAESLSQPGEIAMHLAGGVARLAPIRLAVRGIEQDRVAGEGCALWRWAGVVGTRWGYIHDLNLAEKGPSLDQENG